MPTSKFQKKLYRFIFYLFWVVLAGVLWGELKPAAAVSSHTFWDCTLNFSAYCVLGVLSSWILVPKRTALYAAGAIIVMGVVLEFIQGAIGRDMSLNDVLANTLGVMVGSGIVWGCCYRVCRRRHHR